MCTRGIEKKKGRMRKRDDKKKERWRHENMWIKKYEWWEKREDRMRKVSAIIITHLNHSIIEDEKTLRYVIKEEEKKEKEII